MPIRNNSPKIFYLGKERQNRGGKRYSGLVWEVQAKTTPPSPLPSESVLPAGPRQPWLLLTDVCCCSVAQLCLTLCDSMDCSMPGFRVLHHFLEFAQNSCPLSWWCHPTISSSVTPFFSCPQSFPASRSFLMSWLFASGGQSIGASASASVLPMNIQGWFPLGLTGLISLLSKEVSRVSSSTTIRKHQFFGTSSWCHYI